MQRFLKNNNSETVLVTGGCGAIGSELLNCILKEFQNTHFVNLDALTYCGKRENIDESFHNYTFVEGNICDIECVTRVFENYQPQILIHLAAETHVDQSFGNSFKFTESNVKGTHVLLEAAKQYGKLELFVHMSTDEVYGSVDDNDICTETAMFYPSNPYSASKAAAEMLCHSYMKSFKLPIIIMRCNNAISKYQHPEKLIPRCIDCILEGEKIPIHGKGESKRTFVHGIDIAHAIIAIIQNGQDGEVYNIGTSFEYSVIQVVEVILNVMKPKGYEDVNNWITYVPDRSFQDYRYSIDATKLRNLGWCPSISFEEAVKDVVNFKLSKKD
jgi:dTDP-glucose 4,6-dehydratase